MNGAKLFELMDNIEDKYIADARIKHRAYVFAAKENGVSAFFKNAVSVAAIFLVIGMIFVWTLVGKDILHGEQGQSTTDVTSTTEPQTTPNNVVVPPVTDITTTTPVVTTTPIVTTTQTPITTTAPITTTQPPVTTTKPVTTQPTPSVLTPEELMALDADGVVEHIKKLGCPDDKLPKSATSKMFEAEIKKIIDFLNDPEARRFISSYSDENYFAPAQIDLFYVLRFNRERMEHNLSKDELNKEIEALKAKYPDYLEFMGTDPVRVMGSQFEYLVKKYLGIDTISDDMKKNLHFYLESSDAYYEFTGGVFGLAEIKEANAWNLSDGNNKNT